MAYESTTKSDGQIGDQRCPFGLGPYQGAVSALWLCQLDERGREELSVACQQTLEVACGIICDGLRDGLTLPGKQEQTHTWVLKIWLTFHLWRFAETHLVKQREGNVTKKNGNWPAIINMFKQYYNKMSCSCSLKCVHMASLQKTAVSRCLSSMVNTVTPKEVGSHWSESVPLLPWAERRARYTSLLLFFQADGRGDTAVCPRSNPHPACLSRGNSRPSRFLNIGIVQGVTAMLLSCMCCSYEHLPLLTLPRAGPECTASSPSRSVSCTLCH